jgi:hypothetical protein
VDQPLIDSALADITAETDPTIKHLKLASLVSAIFRERGVELVVVGGSAIEFYTEGAYVSGDIDLCVNDIAAKPDARLRQQLMGLLSASGGPRSWEIGGLYVDLLGVLENTSRTALRRIAGPYGEVRICPLEELIVERILISIYPRECPEARECARKLIAAALQNEAETDWQEIRRLAKSPAYKNWSEVKQLIYEQAQALQIRGPYDSDE